MGPWLMGRHYAENPRRVSLEIQRGMQVRILPAPPLDFAHGLRPFEFDHGLWAQVAPAKKSEFLFYPISVIIIPD